MKCGRFTMRIVSIVRLEENGYQIHEEALNGRLCHSRDGYDCENAYTEKINHEGGDSRMNLAKYTLIDRKSPADDT